MIDIVPNQLPYRRTFRKEQLKIYRKSEECGQRLGDQRQRVLLARTFITWEMRVLPFWARLNIGISVRKCPSDTITPPDIESVYAVIEIIRARWNKEVDDIYRSMHSSTRQRSPQSPVK